MSFIPKSNRVFRSRDELKETIEQIDPIVDYRITRFGNTFQGVIDVDAREPPNVDAFSDTLTEKIEVNITNCGQPNNPKKLTNTFFSITTEEYEIPIYRYEYVVKAEKINHNNQKTT